MVVLRHARGRPAATAALLRATASGGPRLSLGLTDSLDWLMTTLYVVNFALIT